MIVVFLILPMAGYFVIVVANNPLKNLESAKRYFLSNFILYMETKD